MIGKGLSFEADGGTIYIIPDIRFQIAIGVKNGEDKIWAHAELRNSSGIDACFHEIAQALAKEGVVDSKAVKLLEEILECLPEVNVVYPKRLADMDMENANGN